MLYGGNAAKEVWRHDEKILYQGTRGEHFLQRKTMLIGVGYKILEWIAGPIQFSAKLMQKAGIPRNYEKMSLNLFMRWMNLTLPVEKALNVSASRKHWNLMFPSAIQNRNKREKEDGTGRYKSTKVPLVDHMEEQKSTRYGTYWVLLDT